MKRAIAVAAVLALAAGAGVAVMRWRADDDLLARMAQRVPFPATGLEPCPAAGPKRLVILVLGQSNAGNHGAEEVTPRTTPTVMVSNGRQCARSGDPLPGATGRHGSLWSRVASTLQAGGYGREIVFTLLAVDATDIAEWTRPSSPLREALERLLADSVAFGIRPDVVVWQQGEADAQRGTTSAAYALGLQTLASIVHGAGVNAPIIAALSTRCGRTGPSKTIRAAIAAVASPHSGIWIGPDTDAIDESMRHHGCHFSTRGLDEAAALWARVLMTRIHPRRAAESSAISDADRDRPPGGRYPRFHSAARLGRARPERMARTT